MSPCSYAKLESYADCIQHEPFVTNVPSGTVLCFAIHSQKFTSSTLSKPAADDVVLDEPDDGRADEVRRRPELEGIPVVVELRAGQRPDEPQILTHEIDHRFEDDVLC